MYYTREALESDLSTTHRKITRKPWNIKTGDILILSQYGMGFMNSGFMAVEITDIRTSNDDTLDPITRTISHTSYHYTHKPLSPSDQSRLKGWHTSHAYTFDDVEVWRPINTPKTS